MLGTFPQHVDRFVENDAGLFALGRGGVNLRALLAVEIKHKIAEQRQKGRLAVLPWHLDMRDAEAPRAVLVLPAKERACYKFFPVAQNDRLAAPLAFRVPEHLELLERVLHRRYVKINLAHVCGVEVVEMALARLDDQFAGDDLAGDDFPRIIRYRIELWFFRRGAFLF